MSTGRCSSFFCVILKAPSKRAFCINSTLLVRRKEFMDTLTLHMLTAWTLAAARLPMCFIMMVRYCPGTANCIPMLPPAPTTQNMLPCSQWLVYLFCDLDPTATPPIPVYVDNSGVVSLVFSPVDHSTNKHLRIACHYCRELTKEKVILPQRIPGDLNLADAFTKPLPGP